MPNTEGELIPSKKIAKELFEKVEHTLDLRISGEILEHDVQLMPTLIEAEDDAIAGEEATVQEIMKVKSCHWRGFHTVFNVIEKGREDTPENEQEYRLFGH